MKRLILAMVLIAVVAQAQTTEDGAGKLAKYILNHEKIQQEYLTMALELRDLKIKKVDELMIPHMEKIVKLMRDPESDYINEQIEKSKSAK